MAKSKRVPFHKLPPSEVDGAAWRYTGHAAIAVELDDKLAKLVSHPVTPPDDFQSAHFPEAIRSLIGDYHRPQTRDLTSPIANLPGFARWISGERKIVATDPVYNPCLEADERSLVEGHWMTIWSAVRGDAGRTPISPLFAVFVVGGQPKAFIAIKFGGRNGEG